MILAAQPDMEIAGEADNGREAVELAEKLKQSPYRAEAIVLMLTSGERPGDIEHHQADDARD